MRNEIRAGIIDEGITTFIAAIKDAIASGFTVVASPFVWLIDWSPMFGHFVLFVALIMVCLLIGFFLPFQWIRAGLGFIIVVVGAFVLGETEDFKWHLAQAKAKRDAEAAKPKPPKPKPPDGGGDWFRR